MKRRVLTVRQSVREPGGLVVHSRSEERGYIRHRPAWTKESKPRLPVELAKWIGSSQPSVARIDKGIGYRTPQWETLAKIARALGKQVKWKQVKLSFVDVEHGKPLVEVDGIPVSGAEGPRPTQRRIRVRDRADLRRPSRGGAVAARSLQISATR